MCLQVVCLSRGLFAGLLVVGLAGLAAADDAPPVQRADAVFVPALPKAGSINAPVGVPGPPQAGGVGVGGGGFGAGGFGGRSAGGVTFPFNFNYIDGAASPKAGEWVKMFGAEPKKVKAAYLGVSASPLTPAMRSQLSLPAGVGLVVDVIDKDSPAAKAGLRQFDVLHKLNDQILVNLAQLAVLVRTFKPGDEITFTVIRQAKPTTLTAKLTENEVYDLDGVEMSGAAGGSTQSGAGGGSGATSGATAYGFGRVGAVPNMPVPPGFSSGNMFPGFSSGSIFWNDGEHTIRIMLGKGKSLVIATDKDGKEVFRGPIARDADLKALPEAIRKKLLQAFQSTKVEGYSEGIKQLQTLQSMKIEAEGDSAPKAEVPPK